METAEHLSQKPKRHGCLTTFLVLMVLSNTLTALVYLLSGETIAANFPGASPLAFVALGVLCLINLVFAWALFRWKKWGFYGFVATGLLVLPINLFIGVGIAQSLFGFTGVAILYWTLQMGQGRKAWPHLE